MSIERRLRRIEEWTRTNKPNLFIFIIGPSGDYETIEELDRELESPKYKDANILKIIDEWEQEK